MTVPTIIYLGVKWGKNSVFGLRRLDRYFSKDCGLRMMGAWVYEHSECCPGRDVVVLSTLDIPARTVTPAVLEGTSPWSLRAHWVPGASCMLHLCSCLHTPPHTCLPSPGAHPPLCAQGPGLGTRNDVRLWIVWTVSDIWCEGEEAWTEGEAVRITEHSTSNFLTPLSGNVDGPGFRSVEVAGLCVWTQAGSRPPTKLLI